MKLPDTYRIFEPILKGKGGKIYTWGIGSVENMLPFIEKFSFFSMKSTIVVGYSAKSHNMGKLVNTAKEWRTYCPGLKFLWCRNMHTKLWVLNDGNVWVGSANLVRNTLSNVMAKVSKSIGETLAENLDYEGIKLKAHTNLTIAPLRRSYDTTITKKVAID